MSEFGFAYKLKSTSVDKRALRLHRRSIEWKQNREDRLNSARNLESLSPLQEISSNASVDHSYEGKTPSKPKEDNAKAAKNAKEKMAGVKNKNEQQKVMMDKLAKWKAEKELKKKMSANEKSKNKPFKVAHIDYKDLEKLNNKIKGSRIPAAKTFQPPPPLQSTHKKAAKTTASKPAKKSVDTKPSVVSKQPTRPSVPVSSRTKPTIVPQAKTKVPTSKVQSKNVNKHPGKKNLDVNLQKVSTKRGESFAPEEFTFTAPANISSFVFKPLSPNAAASFLNPNQDPGASFIGTDPKRCSTPKSSDSVKKEMESQCEQTFKDSTEEMVKTSDKPKLRRSTRQSRRGSYLSKTSNDSSDKQTSPENKRQIRSSLRSQDRSTRRLSSGQRTLDRSGNRRLSRGSLDRSTRRSSTKRSTVMTPSSGRSLSTKRTRSDRDQDLSGEEQASKRSKSLHKETERSGPAEPVNKPVVDLQKQSATPRRRSTRIARKSLAQTSQTPEPEETIKSEVKVMSAIKVRKQDSVEQNDDVFETVIEPCGQSEKQDQVESGTTDMVDELHNNDIENTKVVEEKFKQTDQSHVLDTETPARRRKSVRRSLHSKTSIGTIEGGQDMNSSPKPLPLDTEDEAKENTENIPEKKLTRSTKRRSFSSVDFVKPSADCTVLSAKRNATKKKRRKTVYDHTVVKSPEEWINLLKDSPMVEMNRRTPKVKTPPPPLDFDLTMEELEQYSPTKQLNFSTSDSKDVKQAEQDQADTPMETNDVNQVESQTLQNYAAQELQVDEVSTTQDSDKIEEDDMSGEHDVPYFRHLLKSETKKLNSMCQKWEDINTATPDLSEDVRGQLRTVIGQAQLLIAQRFKQFEGLVDNCEFKLGEKETTCTDLQGFWEMIFFQVEDVNVKFQNLDKLQANNWDLTSIQSKKPVVKKKVISKPVIKKSAVKSKFAAFRAGMKNKAATNTEDKTIDFGFFKVQSPVKNPSPHCAAGSPKLAPRIENSVKENPQIEEPLNDAEMEQQPSVKPEESSAQHLEPSEQDNGLLSTQLITPLKRKSYVPNIPSPLLQDITPQPRMTRSSSIRKTPLPKTIINDVDGDVIIDKNFTNITKEMAVTLSAQKKVTEIQNTLKNSPVPTSPAHLNSVKNASEKKPRRRSLRARKSVSFCDTVVVPESKEETTVDQDPFSKYLQPMTPRMSMAPRGYSVLDALPDDSFSAQAEAGSDLTFSPLSDGSSLMDSPLSKPKKRHSGLKQLPSRERRRSSRKSVQSPKSSDGDSLKNTPVKSTGSNSSTPDSSDSESNRFPSLNIGFTPVAKSARPSLLFTPPNEQETSLSTTADVPTGQLISFTP